MPADAHLTPSRRRARRAGALALVCGALALSGCGALPPQAPVAAASVISRALTTIAASCGESYRLLEFTPHADLSGLEKTASASAGQLAGISRRHPGWVYQGQTLAKIDTLSVQDLQSCSLHRAAAVLRHAPGG